LFFACHANEDCQSGRSVDAEASRMPRSRGQSRRLVPSHGVSRDMVALSGFGNALVPQVAAEFIAAYMESI
jgi:hypothetical protein